MEFKLAEDVNRMAKDFVTSCDMRLGAVKDIFKDTHQTLNRFHKDRMDMGQQQHKDLSHFVAQIQDTVEHMRHETQNLMEKFHEGQGQIRRQIGKMHESMQSMFCALQARKQGKPMPASFRASQEPSAKHEPKPKKKAHAK